MGTAVLALPAAAQTFAERPIRLVVPFSAGGGTDIMGRRYGAKLGPLLGTQVVIDNKAGASGTIGALDVARAKPDGHTLLLGTHSIFVINPLTIDNLAYDPVKSFSPIAVNSLSSFLIAVHPSVPVKTLKQLIAQLKASPGKYAFGSAAGMTQFSGEMLVQLAGVKMDYIPYKGSGQALIDLLGGQIPVITTTVASATPYHRTGQLRILAVFSEKRSSAAPDLPTAVELGLPGMVAYTFNVVTAPAGTPARIVDQLNRATRQVMADREFLKELDAAGFEAVSDSSPEKAALAIQHELARWAPIVKSTKRVQ
jgi:tripartite-type tricarboxylate transporter receptor subunit TctC